MNKIVPVTPVIGPVPDSSPRPESFDLDRDADANGSNKEATGNGNQENSDGDTNCKGIGLEESEYEAKSYKTILSGMSTIWHLPPPPEERLDHKIILAIEQMSSNSRLKLRACLEGLTKALVPFDVVSLDPESFEDKYRLALPWIRGEAGKIHAMCSSLTYALQREKGAEQTRHLLITLNEITLMVHKLWNPVDSEVYPSDRPGEEKVSRVKYLADLRKLVAEVLDEVVGVDERVDRAKYLRIERQAHLDQSDKPRSDADEAVGRIIVGSKAQGTRTERRTDLENGACHRMFDRHDNDTTSRST